MHFCEAMSHLVWFSSLPLWQGSSSELSLRVPDACHSPADVEGNDLHHCPVLPKYLHNGALLPTELSSVVEMKHGQHNEGNEWGKGPKWHCQNLKLKTCHKHMLPWEIEKHFSNYHRAAKHFHKRLQGNKTFYVYLCLDIFWFTATKQ